MVESNEGRRIYFDPYQIPNEYKNKSADIILGSHDHHDHLDKGSINIIKGKTTEILIPKTCESAVKSYNARAVEPGMSLNISGFPIEVIPAYNPNKKFHPKENKLSMWMESRSSTQETQTTYPNLRT